MKFIHKVLTVDTLLWVIYVSLLAVLLPHTAWAFQHFEVAKQDNLAWALAFVFEAAIFSFTYKLKERIQKAHRLRQKETERKVAFLYRRFATAYLNINGVGLLSASLVSMLANFSHAVEFATPMKAYAAYSLPPLLYEIGFGAILPVMSLLFARVLANTIEDEPERNSDTYQTTQNETRLRKEAENLRQQLGKFQRLESEIVSDRIEAAQELWPELSRAKIAVVARTSPGYVSDVLNSKNGSGQ